MTREEMIEKLIDNDMNDIKNGSDDFLYNILRCGWVGYGAFTIQELRDEVEARE
mgnify:CR=1 FL=1